MGEKLGLEAELVVGREQGQSGSAAAIRASLEVERKQRQS